MSQQFLIVAILLMPMQNLTLFLMGSRYDLSAFVLLGLAVALIARRGIRPRSAVALLGLTALHVALLVWFGEAPAYRLFSGVVWLGGLLYYLLEGSQLRYRQTLAATLLLAVMGVSAVHVLLQMFVLGTVDRPKAWFHEPSFAGLCLYASAAGLLVSMVLVRRPAAEQFGRFLLLVLLFSAALLTFSMHIATFVVTLTMVALFMWLPWLVKLRLRHFGLRGAVLIAIFGGAVGYVVLQLAQLEHFTARLDFENPRNFSLLSWLRGLDQMLAAIQRSPLVGMGLGSTGYFEFESPYSDILAALGRSRLNLTDAYSLAFRLVIEIGLPLTLMFLLYLAARLRAFTRYVQAPAADARERGAQVFNFIFALTVIAGCLLKEPLFPQSFLYVAVLLVTSVPLTAVAQPGLETVSAARDDRGGLPPHLPGDAPVPQPG